MYEDLGPSILYLYEYQDSFDQAAGTAADTADAVFHFLSWHGNLSVINRQLYLFLLRVTKKNTVHQR